LPSWSPSFFKKIWQWKRAAKAASISEFVCSSHMGGMAYFWYVYTHLVGLVNDGGAMVGIKIGGFGAGSLCQFGLSLLDSRYCF
jgi:hypothetical protein